MTHKAFCHVLLGDCQEIQRRLSFDSEHPFGKPGIDYSEEYIVQTWPLSSGWSPDSYEKLAKFLRQNLPTLNPRYCKNFMDNAYALLHSQSRCLLRASLVKGIWYY